MSTVTDVERDFQHDAPYPTDARAQCDELVALGTLLPPELEDILGDDIFWSDDFGFVPVERPASHIPDWPDTLPAHLPADETFALMQVEADEWAREMGPATFQPRLAGLMQVYLRRVLADYAKAGRQLAQSQARVRTFEALTSDCHD